MESEKGRRSVTISDADTQYLTAQVDLAGE
jgi:hypothetical protein